MRKRWIDSAVSTISLTGRRVIELIVPVGRVEFVIADDRPGSPTHGKDGTSHYGDIEKRHMVSPISMLGDLLPDAPDEHGVLRPQELSAVNDPAKVDATGAAHTLWSGTGPVGTGAGALITTVCMVGENHR